MLHDALNLGNKKYFDAATAIIKAFQNQFAEKISSQNKIVIAISGESGCGKTTIAYQLCKQLMNEFKQYNIKAKHIYTDNLYTANYQGEDPIKREQQRKNNNYQNIGGNEYNWSGIDDIISRFKNGEKCRMPCVDVLNQQIDFLETDFNQVDILVFDGLYAIDRRMNADFRFLIDGTYYYQKDWQAIRQKYPKNLDTKELLEEYASEVIKNTNSQLEQDVRGKEKLTVERVIILEKEHQALQQMVSLLKKENYQISTLKYSESWLIK